MDEFITAITSFPTMVFTGALFVVAGYWLLALIGGVGSDLLDASAGKVEGAIDAVAGKAEGALDAVAGKVEGAATGKVEALAGASAGANLFAAIGFGKIPATVVLTLLTLFAWMFSTFGALWAFKSGLAGTLVLALISLGAMLLAGILTGLISRGLGRAFKRHVPIGHGDLIGKLGTVTTGRVDEKFGQANLHEDGADLIVDVRCPTPNALTRNMRVVLVSYDAEQHVYTVEPVDALDAKDTMPRA